MKRILSLASFVCAILFAAAGMMMPPQGEISGSVLILVAQLLILCATFLGIKDYHNIINRKLWLKILKTSGASSSTLLWPPSPPCSRPLVSPSGDTPSRKPMNRPVWFVGVFFLSTDHTEDTECLGYGLYFSCLSARNLWRKSLIKIWPMARNQSSEFRRSHEKTRILVKDYFKDFR